MRNLAGLAAAALLAGCATHQAPPRIISTEWATVEALGAGTPVALIVRDDQLRLGEIKSVTATGVTLREAKGVAVISRGEISRVSVREPTGSKKWPNVLRGAAIGLAITAVPAYLAMAIDENGSGSGGEFAFLLLGPALGAAFGSARAAEPVFRERIVYIRP